MRSKLLAVWAHQKARRSECGPGGDEQGSMLILGMVFLVVISMTIASLANWTMNDLTNTRAFTSAQATSSSVTSVANVAVQSIRYATLLPNLPQNEDVTLGRCWVPTGNLAFSQLTTDGVTVAIWCSTVENLKSPATRVVDLYACVSTLSYTPGVSSAGTISTAAAACKASPQLYVEVTFDDYPPGGSSPLTTQCSTWCGDGTSLDTWSWA